MSAQGKFSAGAAVRTTAAILRASYNVRIRNPEKFLVPSLPIGTLGRVHSLERDRLIVWLYEEKFSYTIILEIPWHMIGTLMEPHSHGMFPHLVT
jgi:hypothetical protein